MFSLEFVCHNKTEKLKKPLSMKLSGILSMLERLHLTDDSSLGAGESFSIIFARQ